MGKGGQIGKRGSIGGIAGGPTGCLGYLQFRGITNKGGRERVKK